MNNKVKLIMSEVLEIPVDSITIKSSSQNIQTWDSLKHMNLVITLEEEFKVSFDEDEMPEIQSFEKIITALENHLANT